MLNAKWKYQWIVYLLSVYVIILFLHPAMGMVNRSIANGFRFKFDIPLKTAGGDI